VISIFTERAQKGLPIAVFGDGEQTRDFVYVGDLVEVLVQALEAAEVPSGAVNVGLSRATSLNELLAAIGDVLGGLPAVSYQAARSGDIRHSRADNTRLLAHYRLPEPATGMREGLRKLLGL
jgi:UDP-glucose 4-epimerase